MAKRKFYRAANRMLIKDFVFLIAAVGCALIGLRGFLLPAGFLDGGVTGIALITRELTDLPLEYLFFLINVPFIIMGRYQISMIFALKTLFAITSLSLALHFVPIEPFVSDSLLIAVFGGFFLGAGIGLAMRGGGVIDGTEVLALYIARKTPFTIGNTVLFINIVIFTIAGLVFSIPTALYAMLTYLSASKTIDFLLHGMDEYTALQIFSEKNASVLHKILKRSLKLNIIVIEAYKGDPSRPDKSIASPILYTVISRLQVQVVLDTVKNIDPKAVIVYHPVTDLHGRP